MVTPAAAAQAPVELPLRGLGMLLPMEPPTVRTAVPVPVPGTPMGLGARGGGEVQPVTVPQAPLSAELPQTEIAAPLPALAEGQEVERVQLTTPASPLRAVTPGATVGSPLTLPRGDSLGLPGVELPRTGLLAPTLTGTVESGLGLVRPRG
ncbi:hypothetical protein [Streptomyces sp. SP18CS02]|uniref:hypothetical protein n=1 Tax=Streptomyces sp. SP18CS02 TaxID=3002531 RepID=UPI002E7A7536|nr:hypothetical protein [Streptomyces sp. SP18CS02]MEE1751116.1 hypothetical protein [Streptomyces sp. SP18CS02]